MDRYAAERLIASIDQSINDALNQIASHAIFKRLEASWRGLLFLIHQIDDNKSDQIRIKLLNITFLEASSDLLHSMDFEQSELFNKMVNEELDRPGGEPYGLMLWDFPLSSNARYLTELAKTCATSFTPLLAPLESDATNQYKPTQKRIDEMRFIGRVTPAVLFDPPHSTQHCWGNPCFHYAGALIQSYQETHWFYHIQSPKLKPTLPFSMRTQYYITENHAHRLAQQGIIAYRSVKSTGKSLFSNHQTTPIGSDKNASNLIYLLSACRFAHYLKTIARDKMGSFISAKVCEDYLRDWLLNYCAASIENDYAKKEKYPLKEASVKLKPDPHALGHYHCILYLRFHYPEKETKTQFKLMSHLYLNR